MQRDLILAGEPAVFTAPGEDYYLETLPLHGPTDLEAIFRAFCAPGDDFVDVGANIGVTAYLAGKIVGPGRVVAVEPVPSTFEHLQRNIQVAGLTNVTCLRLAMASEPQEVSLVSRPGFGFAAYVGQPGAVGDYAGDPGHYAEFAAQALPLDQLVTDEALEHLRFLKIDVEGYELEVLRGAGKVLETFRPVVFLESNPYCLNIFHKVSLVDFVAEILSIFPFVFAFDVDEASSVVSIVDLTESGNLPAFYHESVVKNRFQNLLCGFDADVGTRLESVRVQIDNAAPMPAPDPVEGPPSAGDDSETMTVSRRERELILLKRRAVDKIRGRVPH